MIQVIDLGGDVRIFRGDPLGRRHQLRAHGAGQGNHDLQIQRPVDGGDGLGKGGIDAGRMSADLRTTCKKYSRICIKFC